MRISLLFLLLAAPVFAADPPSHTMKSDQLTLKVFLPDSTNGMYRGTRFDWSGIFSVEFGKHKLFGPWSSNTDPTNHDSLVGPAEEFGMNRNPPNYDDAKVGERFLKIGVGELEKPKEEKYQFYHNYKIAKAGTWIVDRTNTETVFSQTVQTESGYGYAYTKTLTLSGSTICIAHVLENKGKKTIHTDHYNHNFFNVDGDDVGKNYELEFPFAVAANKPAERFAELVKLDGKKFTFTGALDRGSIYSELVGYSKEATDTGVTMKHTPTGVNVRMTGDRPLAKFNVWGIKSTICPEPFLEFQLEAGQTAKWSWNYEFKKVP
jgi:hypothetical protein